MRISREEVVRVAELAQMDLTEEEIRTYREQLDSILSYIDKLSQLDTSSVEPMAQIISVLSADYLGSLRADVVRPDQAGAEILRQAPDAFPPWFKVPRVIER
jgi:aspartyl-tRNA(Asn)/glutamyl-tRNA(Gln) amidotransferase subunit C